MKEGRVEMCTMSRWRTVCGKYWTSQNTAVVCRQLGFSDTSTGGFLLWSLLTHAAESFCLRFDLQFLGDV